MLSCSLKVSHCKDHLGYAALILLKLKKRCVKVNLVRPLHPKSPKTQRKLVQLGPNTRKYLTRKDKAGKGD